MTRWRGCTRRGRSCSWARRAAYTVRVHAVLHAPELALRARNGAARDVDAANHRLREQHRARAASRSRRSRTSRTGRRCRRASQRRRRSCVCVQYKKLECAVRAMDKAYLAFSHPKQSVFAEQKVWLPYEEGMTGYMRTLKHRYGVTHILWASLSLS